jgi:hypothetical protein
VNPPVTFQQFVSEITINDSSTIIERGKESDIRRAAIEKVSINPHTKSALVYAIYKHCLLIMSADELWHKSATRK